MAMSFLKGLVVDSVVQVLAAGSDKRLVLVLNKIDLIPKEALDKWLKYLRNDFPTIAFKASTQVCV